MKTTNKRMANVQMGVAADWVGLSLRWILGFGGRVCGLALKLCFIIIHMATPNPSRVKVKIPKKELADFNRRYQVQKLALFGSVLGNNFRADSDVDVLVSFQPNAHVGFITFSRMQRELSGLFQRPWTWFRWMG
jgi:predicted nucleotidyltransferase